MEVRIRGQMTIADIRQALFEQLHELEIKYAVQFSRGATSIPRMHSVRMLRPACRAVMNSEPCTAQGDTEAQRTKGNYDQTTPVHRAGGGAAAIGPDGRAADASANATRRGAGCARPAQAALFCRSDRTQAQNREERPDKYLRFFADRAAKKVAPAGQFERTVRGPVTCPP